MHDHFIIGEDTLGGGFPENVGDYFRAGSHVGGS
jgi:hypothetical protein